MIQLFGARTVADAIECSLLPRAIIARPASVALFATRKLCSSIMEVLGPKTIA